MPATIENKLRIQQAIFWLYDAKYLEFMDNSNATDYCLKLLVNSVKISLLVHYRYMNKMSTIKSFLM